MFYAPMAMGTFCITRSLVPSLRELREGTHTVKDGPTLSKVLVLQERIFS